VSRRPDGQSREQAASDATSLGGQASTTLASWGRSREVKPWGLNEISPLRLGVGGDYLGVYIGGAVPGRDLAPWEAVTAPLRLQMYSVPWSNVM
jgi:hypothetical protein